MEDNAKARIDAGYFRKRLLVATAAIEALPHKKLGDIAGVFRKGIFDIKADTYVQPGKGIAFVRIGDLRNGIVSKSTTAWISHDAHRAEYKTCLSYGDVILSKTAYPAASFVNLSECNVSQDTIAIKLSPAARREFCGGYIVAFLNSSYGLALMERQFQGNVQQHLSLDDGKKLQIPKFGREFQHLTDALFRMADREIDKAVLSTDAAQSVLICNLGLANWAPPEPLSYTAPAGTSVAAGRLDAQYFAPRIQALLDVLSRDSRYIRDVAKPRHEVFQSRAEGAFHYIEIGDLDGAGEAGSTLVPCADAPSRATWYVRRNDIITSTVRPIRRLSAQIAPEQDGYVCSSGFVVIDARGIAPELLLAYLRLPMICELLDLYASASMYPAITEENVFGLPLPSLEDAASLKIVKDMKRARDQRSRAITLLNAAKRAVEIAIEDSERAALRFLRDLGE